MAAWSDACFEKPDFESNFFVEQAQFPFVVQIKQPFLAPCSKENEHFTERTLRGMHRQTENLGRTSKTKAVKTACSISEKKKEIKIKYSVSLSTLIRFILERELF